MPTRYLVDAYAELAELHERRGDTERALELLPQRNERPTKRQTDPLPLAATLLALS